MNFTNHVEWAARDVPGKDAMSDQQQTVTFRELDEITNAMANALSDRGIESGDRLAIYLPNSIPYLVSFFGAMKAGIEPIPVNMRFVEQELEYVLQDSGSKVIVTNQEYEDTIEKLDVDSLDMIISVDGQSGVRYQELLDNGSQRFDIEPQKDSEVANLMYTSGTTGRPKGVLHTHQNLHKSASVFRRYHKLEQEDVGLTVAPMFHIGGMNVVSTPFIPLQATNQIVSDWDVETVCSIIEDKGVTYTYFAPAMISDLIESETTESYDSDSLEKVFVGGAPMPIEKIDRFESLMDCILLEAYGMTEVTAITTINRPDEPRKPGSSGLVTHETVDLRIEDPETGNRVESGNEGELLWHGDVVSPGYDNLPDANEESYVNRDGKIWLRSGDIGRMDDEGYVFIIDRIDDMIISGGENLYPRPVEDVLYQIDGVVQAAVFGTPHDRLGEMVTAAIVRSDDDDVTEGVIEQACRDELSGYKIPRRIEFLDSLPETSTQKTDKVALRERFSS